MKKSKGKLSKHGRQLKKPVRKQGISKHLREFDKGDVVHIDIDSSVHSGMPAPRLQGRTATIKGKQGRAYKVELTDGKARKQLIVDPAHLKR
jgi:large subunit ribosomal protein L21e